MIEAVQIGGEPLDKGACIGSADVPSCIPSMQPFNAATNGRI
jgi:hypothetical protein